MANKNKKRIILEHGEEIIIDKLLPTSSKRIEDKITQEVLMDWEVWNDGLSSFGWFCIGQEAGWIV